MRSPFPGMDPYLEDPSVWGGMHQRLITITSEMLLAQLRPRGYYSDIGERICVVGLGRRSVGPDVVVTRTTAIPVQAGGTAIAEPDAAIEVEAWMDEERQLWIDIYTSDGELVTVIEILSPSNKLSGDTRERYLQKQSELLASSVNLVEIDLIPIGAHTIAVPEAVIANHPRLGDWRYIVCVHRSVRPNWFQLYPIPLRQRLPRIAIPLKPTDADEVLDLQAVFARCYETGPYPERLDYSDNPPSRMTDDDRCWVDATLKQHGFRT